MKHLNTFLFTMMVMATVLATGLAWFLIYMRG